MTWACFTSFSQTHVFNKWSRDAASSLRQKAVSECVSVVCTGETVNLNRLFPSNTSRERQRHYESSTKAVARSVLLLDSVWSDLFSGLILSVRSSDAWIPWTPLWAFASCSWQNVDCCVSEDVWSGLWWVIEASAFTLDLLKESGSHLCLCLYVCSTILLIKRRMAVISQKRFTFMLSSCLQ